MDKLYTSSKRLMLALGLLMALLLGFVNLASASHLAGADLSYSCVPGSPRTWKIKLSVYRDCTGIALCGSFACTKTLTVKPSGPPLNTTTTCTSFPVTATLVKVQDLGLNTLKACKGKGKNKCTNLGTVSPGIFEPAYEVYIFEAVIQIPPSPCKYWDVTFSENARNPSNTNLSGAGGQDLFSSATINADDRSGVSCVNNAPEFKNEAVTVLCSGMEYWFNVGAVDPDGDSLTYRIVKAMGNGGAPMTYQAPFSEFIPFPLNVSKPPHNAYPSSSAFPQGYVILDSATGDIGLNPLNLTGNPIYGTIVLEVIQWSYDANDKPFIVGITRRDVQFNAKDCGPNIPPRLVTEPSLPNNRPKFEWAVCAGENLCFNVIAKDTDAYPNQPRFDTTYLSWNEAIVRPGKLTFVPDYPLPPAGVKRPVREDRWRFCWQTVQSDGRTLPYYFSVTGMDDYGCPNVGMVTRTFTIRVWPVPVVTPEVTKIDKCGKQRVRMLKPNPTKQTFISARMEIAREPYDWAMNDGKRTIVVTNPNPPAVGALNAPREMAVDTFIYKKGGKYLVNFIVVSAGYELGQLCTKVFTDTIVVDTPMEAVVRDTFVCKYSSVTIPAKYNYATGPFSYTWFRGSMTNAPASGPSINSSYTVSDTQNVKYYVRIFDLSGGCTAIDSMNLTVKQLPTPNFSPDSARLCFGRSMTLDAGNSGGRIKSYKWFRNGILLTDSAQTLLAKDSGNFMIMMIDSFNCQQTDTFKLRINEKIVAYAGIDTSVCPFDTVKLIAQGGMKYKWDKIEGAFLTPVQGKSKNNTVYVAPDITTDYVLTAYYTYPDTLSNYLECSNTDTVKVNARETPLLNSLSTINICNSSGRLINMPFRFALQPEQQSGVGTWSYIPKPDVLVVTSGSTTQLTSDKLPSLPTDTFYAGMQSSYGAASKMYYIKYSYKGPASAGGCVTVDSLPIRVFALPKVTAGSERRLCINRTSPFAMNTHDQEPFDLFGKTGIWSMVLGGGLDSTVNSTFTNYYFNPNAPGALTTPSINKLSYTYKLTYNLSAPSSGTLSCINADTVIFRVVPTPTIDAGKNIAVCKNDLPFSISAKSGATTSSPNASDAIWTVAPNQTPAINNAIINQQNFDPLNAQVPINGGTWKLYYTDSSTGCKAVDSINIEVIKVPVVDIVYATSGIKDSVCKTTNSISFTGSSNPNTGTGLFSGIAVNPNTGVFNIQDPTVIPQNYYTAYYRYEVTKNGTSCTGYDSIITFVQAPPTISVATVNAKCSYDTDPFNLTSTVAPSFYGVKWTHDGNGSFDNDAILTPKYTFVSQDAARQFLNVTATTTNNGVCAAASDSKRLDINPQPKAEFYCATCKGCEPLDAALSAKGAQVGGSTYNWFLISNGTEVPFAPSDSAITKTMATNGVHIIKLKVSTPAGCTSETYDTITVYGIPQAAFEPDPAKSTIAKPFFSFINQSKSVDNQTLKYEWNMGPDPQLPKGNPNRILTDANPQNIPFGDSIACNIPVYLKVITEPGGCIDTAIRTICIDPDITVFIPSAFRPVQGANSAPCADPTLTTCNDYFNVYADGFATIEIYVFNRWGQQVFSSYTINQGWNGKINNNGADCPQDVYIYQVNATSYNGKKYTYSGSITLLR